MWNSHDVASRMVRANSSVRFGEQPDDDIDTVYRIDDGEDVERPHLSQTDLLDALFADPEFDLVSPLA